MRATTLEDYERRLLRAQQLLEARLDETVTPEELAHAASFSLHHFHRIFRARLGESVMQHVRRLRLERAARQLQRGDAQILTVALDAGYESHEAFTRAFADRFGVAPSVFRAQPRPPWQPVGPAVSVRVETFPALRAAFMRSRGGYGTVGVTWAKLIAWMEARGVRGALYGLCPDDPDVTAEAQLRFDACVVVDDAFVAGDLGFTEIPAGTYAVGLHVGPYDRLSETYDDVIGRWFPTSGYEPAPDAVVEHYLNDPSTVAPSDLRTEVRVRIAT